MTAKYKLNGVNILLVEDNAADIRLITEVIQEIEIVNNLHVVRDGVESIDFLRKKGKFANTTTPDIILLDLNLPKRSGFEVLNEIKKDDNLKIIPVVILTISDSEEDIRKAYILHANCYIIKPLEMNEFRTIINSIINFWFKIVKLPNS
ncbi:MAG: response regulator [Candidatus Hermodarchaeota archaeon]